MSLLFCGVMIFSQKTSVTGTALVKVMPKTLFYHGSGLDVTVATAYVINNGNIYVDKNNAATFAMTNPVSPTNAANSNLPDAAATNVNFTMPWTDNGGGGAVDGGPVVSGYGQLIINSGVTTVSGKVAQDRDVSTFTGGTEAVQIAFPFKNGTALATTTQMMANTGTTALTLSDKSRPYHPIFKWNNATISWDRQLTSSNIDPVGYYVVMKRSTFTTYQAAANKTVNGTPNFTTASVTLPTQPTGALTGRNAYNERYSTYVDDPFDATTTSATWGRNMLQLGNPYNSNLDLSYIGFAESLTTPAPDLDPILSDGNDLPTIVGVYKYSVASNDVTSGTAFNYTTTVLQATAAATGKFVAGDSKVLIIKPFEAFVVKFDSNDGQTFNFTDGLKTFNYKARVADNATGTGTVSYRSAGRSNFSDEYYQVRMNLLANGNDTGSRTMVVANQNTAQGDGNQLEANNLWLADTDTSIFTKSEVKVGQGEDASFSTRKMYINAINSSYLGTPIPVHFTVNSADASKTFKIKFDLSVNLKSVANENFNNPDARYYFRDNQENKTFVVDNNTEYEFTQSSSTSSRFQLFFGVPSTTLGVEELNPNALTSTSVYKGTDKNYSIRFDKSWKNANVSVYTAVGQIVFSKNKIDTSSDYQLPLNERNTTVYIVNIENAETGEIVSKKIVK